jgi:hypothetical protein
MVGKSKIIVIVLILSSCNFFNEKNEDQEGFYDYYQDGDIIRLPLKKPYIIYSANNGDDWVFDVPFGDFLKGLQVSNIKSLYVENNLIIFYSDLISLPGETAPAWIIFDLNKKTSKYYTNYDQFIKDFPRGQKMELVSSTFEKFKEKKKAFWME